MSGTEAVIGAVQRIWATPRVIKLAFFLINCGYLLFIIGFSTDGWVSRAGLSLGYRQGLFNHCAISGIFTCCQSLNSHLSENNVDGIPAWITITRVILGVCLIPSTHAIVMIYVYAMVKVATAETRMILMRACYITSYISGVCLLAGIGVYGEKFGREHWQSGASIHISYALTTMGGILFVMAGIAMSFSNLQFTVCKQRDEQDEMDVQRNRRPHIAMIPSAPPLHSTGNGDSNICCVCLTDPVNSTFVSCGHTSCCIDCANSLLTCPICRQTIRSVLRIYRT